MDSEADLAGCAHWQGEDAAVGIRAYSDKLQVDDSDKLQVDDSDKLQVASDNSDKLQVDDKKRLRLRPAAGGYGPASKPSSFTPLTLTPYREGLARRNSQVSVVRI